MTGFRIAAALVFAGCTMLSSNSMQANSLLKLQPQMLVSTAWLQEHLGDRNLVVVCVGRSRSSYDAGHIPGARFLAMDKIVEQRSDSLNELPPVAALQAAFESIGVSDDSSVVLYGESGGLLAARAYFSLDYLGHGDRSALLDGGLEKWIAEGRPTDRYPVNPPRAHLTTNVQPEILLATSQMREITSGDGNGYVLFDSRPPQEYEGEVASEAVPKAGHLPGAHSLYWKTLVQSEAVPALLDVEQLERVMERAGADPQKTVITYCRTGIQSSFTYFVAKYLGYRTGMYDGSVYEWVHQGGYDLVTTHSPTEHPTKR